MSYILDALRKAERERRSGRVPTLDAHQTRARVRGPVWMWILGVALILNAAGLAVYWRSTSRLGPATDGQPSGPAASSSSPATPPARSDVTAVAPVPPAAPVPPRRAGSSAGRGGAASLAPPVASGTGARPAPGDGRPAGTPADARPGPTAPMSPAPVTSAVPAPAPQAPAPVAPGPAASLPVSPAPGTPAPVTPGSVGPLPVAPAPAAPGSGAPGPAPPSPAVPAPVAPGLPALSSVAATPPATGPVTPVITPIPPGSRPPAPGSGDSPAAREANGPGVPPAVARLSLDALVYSVVPAERLVFINSRKYVEGQALEGGLVLEAITTDGAIVSGDGQRYILRPKLNPYTRP
jgi:Type II secretion system protein B